MHNDLFPRGSKLENSNFNGDAWLNMLTGAPLPIANVTFAPGARNNWHEHMGGQTLLVTSGRGYYQEWNEPARELHAGDVVEIPAHVKHWHGAAPNSAFSHIAIELHPEKGSAKWLEPVSDEDYNKLR